jgi:hypothetical protein
MFTRSVVYRILLASVLAVLPVPAFAISQIVVSPAGDGVWQVQGNLENVAGLDVRISYDSSTLSNPQVALGPLVSGMVNAVNPGNPIAMAFITSNGAVSKSGVIATISFSKTGSSPGSISSVVSTAYNSNRQAVAIRTGYSNPSSTLASTDTAGGGSGTTDTTKDTNQTTASGTGQPVLGGTVTLPVDPLAGTDTREAATQVAQESAEPKMASEPAAGSQQTAPQQPSSKPQPTEAQPPPPQPKKAVAEADAPAQPIQSVLEKFRLFSGDRTIVNLTALFAGDGGATFSQSPAVAIADGKSTVKVVISKVVGEKSPNFTFNSARAVSVHSTGEGEWEIIAKPQKDALKASVVMISNGVVQEFPLTVAPRAETVLSKTGAPEADFQLFLNDRGTASAPKYDLNGDGKRDYLDDYIYTANYLVRTGGSAQAKASAKGDQKLTAEQSK